MVVEDQDLPDMEVLYHILGESSYVVSEEFLQEIWTWVFGVTCWSISAQFHLVPSL